MAATLFLVSRQGAYITGSSIVVDGGWRLGDWPFMAPLGRGRRGRRGRSALTMEGLLQGKGARLGPLVTRFPLPERTMLHVLDKQARERPDDTWLVFDGAERLAFGEAQVLAHRFGNALIEELGGACHVALYLRNQVEFFPVFYGALAAGGVAVPLNADARGLLLERVIVKSDARVLVARADLLPNLEALETLGQVELVLVAGPADELPETVCGARVVAPRAAGSRAAAASARRSCRTARTRR